APLDAILRRPAVLAALDPIVDRVERQLAGDPAAGMAWEPVPLELSGDGLPAECRSSWVFVLRGGGAASGAERHPNSRQRMVSWRRDGVFQTWAGSQWQSHRLTSDLAAPLERRWLSIPPYVWHQAIVAGPDWAVVT